jgi:hypothetical protein
MTAGAAADERVTTLMGRATAPAVARPPRTNVRRLRFLITADFTVQR